MTNSRMRVVVLLLALALVAASCDDGDDGGATQDPTTTLAEGPTDPDDEGDNGDGSACIHQGDVDPKEATPIGGLFFLTDIAFAPTLGSAECGTSVLFNFEGNQDGVVGYEIGYAEGPFEDPSGRSVEVGGDAHLRIVFLNGTGVDLSGETARETLTAVPEVPDGTTSIVDIVQVTDFEGSAEFVIGLDGERPFAALDASESPADAVTIRIDVFVE